MILAYNIARFDSQLLGSAPHGCPPPLTAGTMEISHPSGTRLASPPVYRMFSSPMKILMCSRTCPCSVAMRSRTPGYIVQSADNASAKVLGECSIWTLLCPAVNSRNAPGMVASRRQQVALLVGYHAPVTTVSAVTLIPK